MATELNFPITYLPKPPFSVEYEDNIIRSKMEDGYIHTRPRSTRARKKFKIQWDGRNGDYSAVDHFYNTTTQQGSLPFNINFETLSAGTLTQEAKIVFFAEVIFASPPRFQYEGMGVWTIDCDFWEV